MQQEISAVADAIFRAVFLTALVLVLSCVVVRWVLPPLLGLLRHIVQDLIDLIAACAVLPEYWMSTAKRRRASGPPPLPAYTYGYAVGSVAHLVHAAVGWVFRAAASAAGAVPPVVVGAAAGIIEVAFLADWI